MRVIVTGSAGLVGSNLVDSLVERGDDVFGVDNFETGLSSSVSKLYPFTEGSITDLQFLKWYFKSIGGADVLVHCAASYKNPDNWVGDVDTNSMGAVYLIQLAKEYNIKRIIYLQSSLVYGHPQTSPVTLDHQINPTNSYAISKYSCEQYIKLSGIDHVTFRLSNIYGPRGLAGPVPTFYKRLSQQKKCFVVDSRREYIYIDDMVKYLLASIDGVGHGVYHVSTGSDISISELYSAMATAMGSNAEAKHIKRLDDDVESLLLDPERTVKDFGFLPSISLVDGLKKTVEYYRHYGVNETFTHLKMET